MIENYELCGFSLINKDKCSFQDLRKGNVYKSLPGLKAFANNNSNKYGIYKYDIYLFIKKDEQLYSGFQFGLNHIGTFNNKTKTLSIIKRTEEFLPDGRIVKEETIVEKQFGNLKQAMRYLFLLTVNTK